MAQPVVDLPREFNVAVEFVDKNVAEGRGDKVALFYEDKTYTYRQVQELTNRVGNGLLALDVEPEQRVMLLLLDTPEFVGSFFGAIKIGAVPVPVNTLLKAPDYLYMLRDSRAKVLIVAEPLLAEVAPVLRQAPRLEHVVVVGKAQGPQHDFARWAAGASPALDAADTTRDDVALWLYSSGSTGFPKGVVHLHHDMVYCADTYARQVLGITESDRTFAAAKLFFAYGLGDNLYFQF
ncbi:MAG: AMP-binding protein, partial [Candidatus Rokubacteria bacterium]|nr:AMP-binding protein [Candidatus Rokubacteria bacterium]